MVQGIGDNIARGIKWAIGVAFAAGVGVAVVLFLIFV